MRRLLVAVTAALLSAVLAAPATAVAPVREDLPPFDATSTLTGICSFPVTVDAHLTGSQTVFLDQAGNPTRIEIDTHEVDTFSANGKTLVGEPYDFKLVITFDRVTGEVTHIYARGIASRVRLPGGDLFLTAGLSDFITHDPNETFVLQPDVGAQGNVAGFCAALAP